MLPVKSVFEGTECFATIYHAIKVQLYAINLSMKYTPPVLTPNLLYTIAAHKICNQFILEVHPPCIDPELLLTILLAINLKKDTKAWKYS